MTKPEPIIPGGLCLVDKPPDWTSHDVVAKIRRFAGTRKVGHAGTLDPMATGLLIVGVGQATKLLTYLVGCDKVYEATVRLGASTNTDDREGEVISVASASAINALSLGDMRDTLEKAVRGFRGVINQVPSTVSAIKIDGKRAYARVRSGEKVTIPARRVTIHRFDLGSIRQSTLPTGEPCLDVDAVVGCSSGTYIRALARDLGAKLGVGGHLTALRRTSIGPHMVEDARTLNELSKNFALTSLEDSAKSLFPSRVLDAKETEAVSHGQKLASLSGSGPQAGTLEKPIAGFTPDGALAALLVDDAHSSKPIVVFL